MTHQQFIAVLCVYALAVVFGFVAAKHERLPKDVPDDKVYKEAILRQKSKLYIAVYGITAALILSCLAVGFVGMLFLWPVAPWLFALSVAGDILFYPRLGWRFKSELESKLSELQMVMAGVIVTLVFFGPARYLFFGK